MNADPKNCSVIHCKAGKGRSGTMTCCYLLSLPELPQLDGVTKEKGVKDKLERDDAKDLLKNLNKQAPHPATQDLSPSQSRSSTVNLASEADSTDLSPAENEAVGIADKLGAIFDLHTKQRMQPGYSKTGVSIPSQKRFVRYFNRLLNNDDPRSTTPSRRVKITAIDITLQKADGAIASLLARKQISVVLATYKKKITDQMREREEQIKQLAAEDSVPQWNEWLDVESMFIDHRYRFLEVRSFLHALLP